MIDTGACHGPRIIVVADRDPDPHHSSHLVVWRTKLKRQRKTFNPFGLRGLGDFFLNVRRGLLRTVAEDKSD
jgi:hypothetical protein